MEKAKKSPAKGRKEKPNVMFFLLQDECKVCVPKHLQNGVFRVLTLESKETMSSRLAKLLDVFGVNHGAMMVVGHGLMTHSIPGNIREKEYPPAFLQQCPSYFFFVNLLDNSIKEIEFKDYLKEIGANSTFLSSFNVYPVDPKGFVENMYA